MYCVGPGQWPRSLLARSLPSLQRQLPGAGSRTRARLVAVRVKNTNGTCKNNCTGPPIRSFLLLLFFLLSILRSKYLWWIRTMAHIACSDPAESAADPAQPLPPAKEMKEWEKYLSLCKPRLGLFVLLTTVAGYAIAPGFDVGTLLATSVGTSFTIASAHALNQWLESPYDARMRRTANRVLVTGQLSHEKALAFGVGTGVIGTAMLAATVNDLVAALAGGNILLYVVVYTPLKRVHWINTWVGAIVGAIPPLIGWAANTGNLYATPPWALSFLLFMWQIPHFLSLSWNHEKDYGEAGYKMLTQQNRPMVPGMSLLHTVPLFFVAFLLVHPAIPVAFPGTYTGATGYFFYTAYNFWWTQKKLDCQKLFYASLWYLPVALVLIFAGRCYLEENQDDTSSNEKAQVETQ